MWRQSWQLAKLDLLESPDTWDSLRCRKRRGPTNPRWGADVWIRDFRPRGGFGGTLQMVVETGHLAGVIVGDGGRHCWLRFVGCWAVWKWGMMGTCHSNGQSLYRPNPGHLSPTLSCTAHPITFQHSPTDRGLMHSLNSAPIFSAIKPQPHTASIEPLSLSSIKPTRLRSFAGDVSSPSLTFPFIVIFLPMTRPLIINHSHTTSCP